MKTRHGFVSNSSSSSFVVFSREELTIDFINKCLNTDGHPAEYILSSLAKFIIGNKKTKSFEDIAERMFGDREYEEPGSCEAQKKKFDEITGRLPFVYMLEASSDDDDFGPMLRDAGEECETIIKCDDLFITSMWGKL
jgi:hypothetical protein